ncbi:DUF1534 domain-containing protein [Pseudomonas syringae pv. maculicola]|nr:DUF1534 domain-containing protein [Pseudomonas syringae pv. maculicola]
MCSPGHLSFFTLQRRNVCRDAPLHRSALHRAFRIGRGASRASHDN